MIVDVRLPDGDGMDLIPLANQRRAAPDVVVITGFATEETLKKALRLGVLDFLEKPFSAANVGEMLRARTIRERQRIGIRDEKFERVDREFGVLHAELRGIRELLDSWASGTELRRRGASGAT
jgi:response regulator of citrate/malate metabolism